MTDKLRDLITRAQAHGWSSTTDTSLEELTKQARQQELFEPVRDRSWGPEVSILEPRSAPEAPERSLSAKYGLGPQPLHTDGAHHADPPDFILLSSPDVSSVPTLLWGFQLDASHLMLHHDFRNGLFTVRTGKSCFLAPAVQAGRIRYDPGCMESADARARRVAEFFDSTMSNAVPFAWDTPGAVLAIANRHTLHARADASEEKNRKLSRLALRLTEKTATTAFSHRAAR